MAITTYSELQTSVGTWLERGDLAGIIPDFVDLFEAYANRTLRTRQMETSETFLTPSGSAALPSEYLNFRSLTWSGETSRELDYVTPSWLRARYPSTETGTPTIFTIEGENIVTRPVDDSTEFVLRYYQKISGLSDANTSNWLLAAHPDAYLFGCLVEAHAYIPDPEKAILWKARRDEACSEVQSLGNLSKGAGPIRPFGAIV
jgi:hypothetical protein